MKRQVADRPTLLLFSPPGVFGDCLSCFLGDLDQVHLMARFKTVPEVLSAIPLSHPALVVVDLWEAVPTAVSLTHAIKVQWPGQPCLVLANTPEHVEQAQVGGADAVLFWRLWPDKLEAKIVQLIAEPATARPTRSELGVKAHRTNRGEHALRRLGTPGKKSSYKVLSPLTAK